MNKPRFKTIAAMFCSAKHWTRGTFARRIDGSECLPRSIHAVCWCLSGALTEVYTKPGDQFRARQRLEETIGTTYGHIGLVRFNDTNDRTIEEIRQVVREARV